MELQTSAKHLIIDRTESSMMSSRSVVEKGIILLESATIFEVGQFDYKKASRSSCKKLRFIRRYCRIEEIYRPRKMGTERYFIYFCTSTLRECVGEEHSPWFMIPYFP